MKVSIAIPTFNQGGYIRACLESIQMQTHQDIEVIIQDSMSQDQTQSICTEFAEKDARFRYFREKDSGQSDAINRGLNRSSGQIWTWICSDDLYADSGAIEALVERLQVVRENDPNVVGVFGDAQYVDEKGEFVEGYGHDRRDLTREDFQLTWPLSQPSSMLWREAVLAAGGVDTALHLGMDLDLFLKVLTPGRRFVYVPKLVVSVRLQPDSKSVKYRTRTAETALEIVRKHFGSIGNVAHSAYAREFAIGKRKEFAGRIVHGLSILFFFIVIPLRLWNRFGKFVSDKENLAKWPRLYYLKQIWRVYCSIRHVVFIPFGFMYYRIVKPMVMYTVHGYFKLVKARSIGRVKAPSVF